MNSTWVAWCFVFAAGINTCIANLLLKRSRLEVSDPGLVALFLSPWLLSALVFFGLNVILFTKALDKIPVSAAYPVLAGLGFSLLAISSSWFFGERLGFNQWLGISFILAGLIMTSRG
jgi:multidrug transporter EmrE-like cation transporter